HALPEVTVQHAANPTRVPSRKRCRRVEVERVKSLVDDISRRLRLPLLETRTWIQAGGGQKIRQARDPRDQDDVTPEPDKQEPCQIHPHGRALTLLIWSMSPAADTRVLEPV